MNRFSDRGSIPLASTTQSHLNGEFTRYTASANLKTEAVLVFLAARKTYEINSGKIKKVHDKAILYETMKVAFSKDCHFEENIYGYY